MDRLAALLLCAICLYGAFEGFFAGKVLAIATAGTASRYIALADDAFAFYFTIISYLFCGILCAWAFFRK